MVHFKRFQHSLITYSLVNHKSSKHVFSIKPSPADSSICTSTNLISNVICLDFLSLSCNPYISRSKQISFQLSRECAVWKNFNHFMDLQNIVFLKLLTFRQCEIIIKVIRNRDGCFSLVHIEPLFLGNRTCTVHAY